uniref:Uncharacterized protein n=1 Tax=Otolemur garnettii TaxID=30611 RepID=H0XKC3_OTOGA
MENDFFSLKSISATWLNPCSTSWMTDITLGFVCGLGLFLVLLPCLGRDPSSAQTGQKRYIRKEAGKADQNPGYTSHSTLRMKPESVCRDCLRILKGVRDLILLLQSHLRKLPDKGDFHQLSCEDSPGELNKPTLVRAHQPCGEHVEATSPTTLSALAFPAPLDEHPPFLATALSSGLMASPVCEGSHSSLSAPQLPELLLPLEDSSPQPQALSPLTGKSPASCPLPLPASSLAHPQCDPIVPPVGSVPPSFSSQNKCPLPVSTTWGFGHSSGPVSALSWWQAAARASRAWCLSTSPQTTSQQEHPPNHTPEASFWRDTTHREMEAGGLSFVNPGVQNLLEIFISKGAELELKKGKEKEGSFLKQLKSPGRDQDTTTPHSFWNVTDKPQKLSHPKVRVDHLQQKSSQLFWGLPSLHSESLVAATRVS